MSTNTNTNTKTQRAIAKAMSLYTKEDLAKRDLSIVQAYGQADKTQSTALHNLYIELAKARRGELHLAHGFTKFDEYVSSLLKGSILEKAEISKQSASKYADAGDALLLMPDLQKTSTGLQALQTLKQTVSKLSDKEDNESIEDLKSKVSEAVKQGVTNISQSEAKSIKDTYVEPTANRTKYDYCRLNDIGYPSNEWKSESEYEFLPHDKEIIILTMDDVSIVAMVDNESKAYFLAGRRKHVEPKKSKPRKNGEVFMYTADDAEKAMQYKLSHPEDKRSLSEILHELVK